MDQTAHNGPQTMTGAQAVVKSLENLGVDLVFGIPGGAILPLYDPLFSSTIRHVLVRHEQGAGHAAEGYALATGRVGVAIVTSGPAATNLVTALADAMMDSVPMVAITGQVGTGLLGTDAFQEADTRGITMPVTKHSMMIRDAQDVPAALVEAFEIASTGRPGPVLVDLPKDVQNAMMEFTWPVEAHMPGYRPVTTPHHRQVADAAEMIAQAKRPVLYIGGGVVRADASEELKAFVDKTGIPVTTTLMALGAYPETDPLFLGMPGMHGTVAANGAMQKSDLLITIGARFDDRVTGELSSFAPGAKVIHADVDPAEIGKIRAVDIPIVGDAKEVLAALNKAYDGPAPEIAEWVNYLQSLKARFARGYDRQPDGSMSPQYVIERLSAKVGQESIFVTGVGQHQMWAAQFLDIDHPHRWLTSGGAGTMGYCLPAAMGAKAGKPDMTVWAIDGDGSFQMTQQELTTCTLEGFPVKIAIINNANLGMVRQWQTLFYEERYSNTKLRYKMPDFVKLGEAMGAHTIRVEKAEDVDAAIDEAMSINDQPVLIDFIVGEDAQVWPMVAAGTSNSDIEYARGLRPLFDEDSIAASRTDVDADLDGVPDKAENYDQSNTAAPGPAPTPRTITENDKENTDAN